MGKVSESINKRVSFKGDVTIPDHTVLEQDTVYTKEWLLRNKSRNDFLEETTLVVCQDKDNIIIPEDYAVWVGPQKAHTIFKVKVRIHTPKRAGRYNAYCRLQDRNGVFGIRVWISIFVHDAPWNPMTSFVFQDWREEKERERREQEERCNMTLKRLEKLKMIDDCKY